MEVFVEEPSEVDILKIQVAQLQKQYEEQQNLLEQIIKFVQFHDKTIENISNQIASSTVHHSDAVSELVVSVTNDRIDNLNNKVNQIHEDLLSKVDSVEIKVFGEKTSSTPQSNKKGKIETNQDEVINDDVSVATQVKTICSSDEERSAESDETQVDEEEKSKDPVSTGLKKVIIATSKLIEAAKQVPQQNEEQRMNSIESQSTMSTALNTMNTDQIHSMIRTMSIKNFGPMNKVRTMSGTRLRAMSTDETSPVADSMNELHLVHNLNTVAKSQNQSMEPPMEIGIMTLPNMGEQEMLGSLSGKSHSMPAMDSEREPIIIEASKSTPNLKNSVDGDIIADELIRTHKKMRRKIMYGNDNSTVKKRVPLVMYVKEEVASIVERVGILEKDVDLWKMKAEEFQIKAENAERKAEFQEQKAARLEKQLGQLLEVVKQYRGLAKDQRSQSRRRMPTGKSSTNVLGNSSDNTENKQEIIPKNKEEVSV